MAGKTAPQPAPTGPERDQLVIPGLEDVLGRQFPPKLKFEAPGQVHTLRIYGARSVQDTEYRTGKLKFWPSGDPQMVLVLIGTDGDDNPACFWVSGKRASDALRAAFSAAEVYGVAVGDVWTITRGPDEELPLLKGEKEPKFANTWEMSLIPAGVA